MQKSYTLTRKRENINEKQSRKDWNYCITGPTLVLLCIANGIVGGIAVCTGICAYVNITRVD